MPFLTMKMEKKARECKNVTYNEKTVSFVDVWGDGENTWQGSDFGGTYEEAITE